MKTAAYQLALSRLKYERFIAGLWSNPSYHLYVIYLPNTGHFYIGRTMDPTRREQDHHYGLRSTIWRRRGGNQSLKPLAGQLLYNKFADLIEPHVGLIGQPNEILNRYYKFSVIAHSLTKAEIVELEKRALTQSYGNDLCLNNFFPTINF